MSFDDSRSGDAAAAAPDESLPTVRLLIHGAERSGPPIYALRLARWWAQHPPPFRPEFVVARPGPLVADLSAAQPTVVARLDRRSPERIVERAVRTAAGARVADAIRRGGVLLRVGHKPSDLTVVSGATTPTVELLRALEPPGRVALIAHELSTGWFDNISASDRAFLLGRVGPYLAVSQSVRSFLVDRLGVDPGAVTVVPPPIDPSSLPRPALGGSATVAGCGVTDWRKAPDAWLRVMALVRHRLAPSPLRCRWVGGASVGGVGFWPLEHEMRHLGLVGTVEFLGIVEDPWGAVGPVSVLVSTAREDAHPLAVAEAIAGGVPVVGFDVDGVGEMIRDSGCGVAVPYPDESALADAIVDLLNDPMRRQQMGCDGGAWGREHVAIESVGPRVTEWITAEAA